MITGINDNYINTLQNKAKQDLINNILKESSNYLKGSQLMELNVILNNLFNNYEIFIKQDIELHKNYREENQTLLDIYLNNKKLEGLSQRTLSYYEDTITKFLEYIDKHLSDVTSQDIRDYLTYAQSLNNCSNTTLDNLRRNFNTFFNTLSNEGYIQRNPMSEVKKIKSTKKVKQPFTTLEIEKMRDYLNNRPQRTKMQQLMKYRNIVIFELLLSSGIRLQELTQLNKEDIDLDNCTFIVLGKGNKERICYFSSKCQYALSKLLNFKYTGLTRKYKDAPALLISKNPKKGTQEYRLSGNAVERWIREVGQECGVKAHPHKFRRTMATTLLNKGVPIEQIKELLGHSNIDTTMIYVSVDQEQMKYNHNKYMS